MSVSTGSVPSLIKDSLIEADQWHGFADLDALINRAFDAAMIFVIQEDAIAFLPECELSLLFTDDEAVRQLNATHRGKDKPTNVLSFPQDEEADIFGPMLGDIVFAYETIEREASELGLAFCDHLTHLCVHGFLHLLGYDHLEMDEAEKMEKVEISILSQLGLANPYAGTIPLDMPD